MMTYNGIFTMNDKHTQSENEYNKIFELDQLCINQTTTK